MVFSAGLEPAAERSPGLGSCVRAGRAGLCSLGCRPRCGSRLLLRGGGRAVRKAGAESPLKYPDSVPGPV